MHPSRHRVAARVVQTLATTMVICAAATCLPPLVRAQTICPAAATVVVAVENLSADASVTLHVEGELRNPAATCEGAGATSYAATFTCTGTGVVRCGTFTALRPGAWINRVTVAVTGTAEQAQARQAVFVAGTPASVSNVLTWTVYPATFVVESVKEADLRKQLDAARDYTASHPGPALVRFAPTAFPGSGTPQTVDLAIRSLCPADGRRAALCLTASRVVVDALDASAEPGAVVLSVGSRAISLLRIYGADNVLRGLVFQGSTDPELTTQADTVAFVGAGALRNRLERSIVRGPTNGDATSAENGPGAPTPEADTNVVDTSEITGAEDRGLKVSTGAHVTLRESCVHDNRNGGVQSTLGGAVVALGNLVQHNVPGPSDNGFSVGTPGTAARSTLTTAGNIVRFSGGRGLAVVDNGDATLSDDAITDNQFAGARVETIAPGGVPPAAAFSGVMLACNNQSDISGTCTPAPSGGAAFCTSDVDCCATATGCCVLDAGCAEPVRCAAATPLGFGAVVDACSGCAPPAVSFGNVAAAGRNALTMNANVFPNARGTNLAVSVAGLAVAARGNQWEHCGTTATCDTAAVAADDVQLAAGASADVAGAAAARVDVPTPQALSLGRPRAGDLVRVFGTGFNAIDGADCAQMTAPLGPCSAENPRVAAQNRSHRNGNRVRLLIAGQALPIDVDAVTPTMLAFRMPVDCFASASLETSKRNTDDVRVIGTIPFCDPRGCLHEPDGTPCEDGAFCTVADTCTSDTCAGTPRDCAEVTDQCHTARCNEATDQCEVVVKLNGTPCDDGNACTSGDACNAGACVAGPPLVCGPFLNCDPQAGCVIGRAGCRKPVLSRRAPLLLRDQLDDRRDGLSWQWTAGAATTKADFGDPLTTTAYRLTIYDGSGAPVLHTDIPPGGICGTRRPKPCWKETTTGFRYDNPALTPDGISRLVLRAGEAKKARILVQGRGALLALPALPLTQKVTVQLERSDGTCWDADYDTSVTKNDEHTLKARGD